MGRRTKEELLAANYYEWLAASNVLREKKKGGTKLTATEKMLLRTVPSPESPYVPTGQPATPAKKKTVKKKIDFDANVVWPVKANAFLCAVYNTPYTDEQCMLLCERDDCPFHGKGYFRMHGVKF
jgi:hypothetical protein